MEDKELHELVSRISLQAFSKPFKHQATMNPRLRTTGGRYMLKSHHLEFNPRVLEQYGMDELLGVIIHELCHYHLHLEGKGYQHKDKDFKELLAKTGGNRYVKDLRTTNEKQANRLYICLACSQKYPRKRKINTRKYVCGKCGGKLRFRAIATT